MFYRRKILLALLEAFGGTLNKTDCQKLLFLFCSQNGNNYYDFFPHNYGNFSIILAQDKNRLADLGYLTSHSDFQLKGKHAYLQQLKVKDRLALTNFTEEIGNVRGKDLIHKVYIEAPHYASRSLIAKKILDSNEYERISASWDNTTSPCLFTVGYEGLTIDAYLDLLITNNVRFLVDVRKNPISMKYGFSKTKLADYTKIAGITYTHLPDLGIPSDLRQDLNSEKDYKQLFDFYASHILPYRTDALKRLKTIINENGRVAITCFEANYHFCHRHKVADYLENDPDFTTPIIHLCKEFANQNNKRKETRQNGLWEENTLYSSI